jgi:hypothetical protein
MTDKVFIQVGNKVVEAKQDNLAYVEAWRLDLDTFASEQAAKKQAILDSKNSAIEKLTALGLTQQEVFDLLGIVPEEPEEK